MSTFKQIIKSIPSLVTNPVTAIKTAHRRLFPFGIKPKDKEAYRIGSWSYGKLERERAENLFPALKKAAIKLVNSFDRDPYTSMDVYEAVVICGIAKTQNCKRILEIGTFNGNTTINLAANVAEDAKVVTLDLPEDWDGKLSVEVPSMYKNHSQKDEVGIHINEHPELQPKITRAFGDSATIDWSSLGGPFDLIFIDGCHHYKYVISDTENAIKNLAPNGIIVWHDYGMIEDVSRAVDEYSGKLKLNAISGTRMAIGRK